MLTSLSVEHPVGDLELLGVLEDGDDSLKLVRVELTSSLVEVDVGLLADDVCETATDTLDLGQGVHDLALSVNVGVEETQDVRKLLRLVWDGECAHGDVMMEEGEGMRMIKREARMCSNVQFEVPGRGGRAVDQSVSQSVERRAAIKSTQMLKRRGTDV